MLHGGSLMWDEHQKGFSKGKRDFSRSSRAPLRREEEQSKTKCFWGNQLKQFLGFQSREWENKRVKISMRQIHSIKSARRESDSDGQVDRIIVTWRRDPLGPVAEGTQINAGDRDGGGTTSRSVYEDREHGPIEDDEGDGELRG